MIEPAKTMKKMVEPLKTGELLVKEGFICLDDIDMALSIQQKRNESVSLEKKRLLGMILCDLNLITPVDNFHVLYRYNKLETISSRLISGNKVSRPELEKSKALAEQKNIPLISYLLKTGQVSTTDMQKILFDLFHVPFRSVRDFSFNSRDKNTLTMVLGYEQSVENQIVPLMLKANTMLFGITDPKNMLFIHELSDRFPQFRFKVVFIPFWGFSQFNKMIYNTPVQQEDPKGKSLDLSLLLKFKTAISDPALQKEAIQTLYHRYEQLHHLTGQQEKENRQDDFTRFIQLSHEKITNQYRSHSIEFSLKKANNRVKVMALPKR